VYDKSLPKRGQSASKPVGPGPATSAAKLQNPYANPAAITSFAANQPQYLMAMNLDAISSPGGSNSPV